MEIDYTMQYPAAAVRSSAGRCGRSVTEPHSRLLVSNLFASQTAVPLISNPTACRIIRTPQYTHV